MWNTRIARLVGVTLVVVLSALGFSQLAVGEARAAVVPGGMAVVHRTFPQAPDGYADIQTTITITDEPGNNGNTFWAHQWGYARGGEGGYVGLQQRGGTAKYLNFSIWGASAWQEVALGANCRYFGHEGSGVQCDMPFAWEVGVTYRITIEKAAATSWRALITDTGSGATARLATITLPDDRGGISSLSEWVENFSQGSGALTSCEAVPPAVARFGAPTANRGTVFPTSSSAYTYGTCGQVAQATCSSDQSCTLAANAASYAPIRVLSPSPGSDVVSGQVLFSGTATAGRAMHYSVDGGEAGTFAVSAAGSWSQSVGLPASGLKDVRFWYAIFPDEAVTVRVAVVNPLSVSSPATGADVLYGSGPVTFTGTGAEAYKVWYAVDGGHPRSFTIGLAPSGTDWKTPVAWSQQIEIPQTVGTHAVAFWYDVAPANSRTTRVAVVNPLAVSFPADAAIADGSRPVTLRGTGAEAYRVSYTVDGGPAQSFTIGLAPSGTDWTTPVAWSQNIVFPHPGAHTVKLWYDRFPAQVVEKRLDVVVVSEARLEMTAKAVRVGSRSGSQWLE